MSLGDQKYKGVVKSIILWGKKENLILESFVTWWLECWGPRRMEEVLGQRQREEGFGALTQYQDVSVSRPTNVEMHFPPESGQSSPAVLGATHLRQMDQPRSWQAESCTESCPLFCFVLGHGLLSCDRHSLLRQAFSGTQGQVHKSQHIFNNRTVSPECFSGASHTSRYFSPNLVQGTRGGGQIPVESIDPQSCRLISCFSIKNLHTH